MDSQRSVIGELTPETNEAPQTHLTGGKEEPFCGQQKCDTTKDCATSENTHDEVASQNSMDFGSLGALDECGSPGSTCNVAHTHCSNGQKSKRPSSPGPHPVKTCVDVQSPNPRLTLCLSKSPKKAVDTPNDVEMLSPESPICKTVLINSKDSGDSACADDSRITKAQVVETHSFVIDSDSGYSAKERTHMIAMGSEDAECSSSSSISFALQSKDKRWLGTPIDELNRMPQCAPPLSHLKALPNHTVTVRTDLLREDEVPVPYPTKFKDAWDDVSVKMPCSEKNLFPMETEDGGGVQSRWDLIHTALQRGFKSSLDVRDAILRYNTTHAKKWDFTALNLLCTEYLEHCEVQHLFEVILPAMVDLALSAPHLCTMPIPLLKARMNHSLTLSQDQIACLLANAFFCTFPRRNSRKSEYCNYPEINFYRPGCFRAVPAFGPT